MSPNPEQITVITLTATMACEFEILLGEYADVMGADTDECRAGAELIVAQAGLRAFNEAIVENRRLAARMGWP